MPKHVQDSQLTHQVGMMPEISLLTDSTTDLQSCKWIPSGTRYMLGLFVLLSSHALFRHQIWHHVRCQQLAHLQSLSLVFTQSSQPTSPVHQESAPALSPFSSNPFHSTTGAAHLQHFAGRPLCASNSYLCCDILLQPFTCRMTNHQLLGSVRRSSWLKPSFAFYATNEPAEPLFQS